MPPQQRPFTAWVIIFIAVANVAVFGWEIAAGADPLQPTSQWMAAHGGNFAPLTFAGEPWRLVTSMFLHYGLLHLVMNMVGLISAWHVEKMFGRPGFIALYLVGGLAGSLVSGLRGVAVSAGASGAIFAVFGAYGAYLFLHRARFDSAQVKQRAKSLAVFLGLNIVIGASQPGIDMAAHLGGFAGGFLVGLALEAGTDEGPSTIKRSLIVGVLGCALALAPALFIHRSHAFEDFVDASGIVERRWNELVVEMKGNGMTDDQIADAIDTEILPPWRAARIEFAKDPDAKHHDDVMDYLQAREDGWTMAAKAARAHDLEAMKAAMTRFKEGDPIVARLNGEK